MVFLGLFGHFGVFKVILVIFGVRRVFWSLWYIPGYFGYIRVFRVILVILEFLGLFWYFRCILVIFSGYFNHFGGFEVILIILKDSSLFWFALLGVLSGLPYPTSQKQGMPRYVDVTYPYLYPMKTLIHSLG